MLHGSFLSSLCGSCDQLHAVTLIRFLWSSSSEKHHGPRPAVDGGPGGTKRHHLLPDRQLPAVRRGPEEADRRDGAALGQRDVPIGQRHGQRLRAVPGQRDKRPRIPGQSLQHHRQRFVRPRSRVSPVRVSGAFI